MKRTILAIAIAAVALPVIAQQSTQRGSDGSITVARPSDAGSRSAAGAQPPIVIVGGKRQVGTDWVAPVEGTLSVGTAAGARSVKLNPKGGNVSLTAGSAVQAPTIMRNGAVARWVPQSKGCPAYYSGSITWEAEEVSSISNGAWTATGAIRNYVESCTAVVETRWVAQSAGCPAGYSGSNTWEAEERRVGGGSWAATGGIRSQNNSCTAPPPPDPDPVPDPGSCSPQVKLHTLSTAPLPVPLPPTQCGPATMGRLAIGSWNIRAMGQNCMAYQATYQCVQDGWEIHAYNSSNCGGLYQTGKGGQIANNWEATLETALIADDMYTAGKVGRAMWDARAPGQNAMFGIGCIAFPLP